MGITNKQISAFTVEARATKNTLLGMDCAAAYQGDKHALARLEKRLEEQCAEIEVMARMFRVTAVFTSDAAANEYMGLPGCTEAVLCVVGGTIYLADVSDKGRKPVAAVLRTPETLDLGNNESKSRGVFPQADGTFTALTFSQSKSGFKTRKGAERWLARKLGG